MTPKTRILYTLRHVFAAVFDVTMALAALGGAGMVLYGLWHGGVMRWAAVGAIVLCSVVALAATVVGGRARRG